jgi:hypothetical protein
MMDHERFDVLARVLAAPGSRRAALGILIGSGMLGATEALARKGKKRGNGKKGRGRVRAQQVPANCFTNANCTPGPGKNLSKCDYAGSTTLRGKNLKGANLGNANLVGADATDADLRGANLDKACLTNADLRGAKINASTNVSTAIFCGTIMPDGSINDRDCGRPTRCCETCTPTGDVCTDDTAPCCEGWACAAGVCGPPACLKDADCGPNEACIGGECVCQAACGEPLVACGGFCFTVSTTEGGACACAASDLQCAALEPCADAGDCDLGFVCATSTCCEGGPFCVPRCVPV